MPPRSRPGIGRSRAAVAPPASTIASNVGAQLVGGDVDADVDAGAELGALGPHLVQPPVEVALLHLELGDAVAQQPADAVGALEHDHVVARPGQLLGRGQPGRPGADDRDPLAGRPLGGCGATQPSSQARSMISTSTCLIVTGSALMPSTHDASHGAGHSLPVNSGKLFVACSRSIAAASRRGRPGRSTPGSGSRAGSRRGRTGCRSPCNGWPAGAAAPDPAARRPRGKPRATAST